VGEDSDRFRKRARECRRLAGDARDTASRDELEKMAVELDNEANIIDAQDPNVRSTDPGP